MKNNNNKNTIDRGPPKGLAPKRKRNTDDLRKLMRRGGEEEGVLVGWPSLLLIFLLLSTNLRCVGSQQDKVDDNSSQKQSTSMSGDNNNNFSSTPTAESQDKNKNNNNNNNPSLNNKNNNLPPTPTTESQDKNNNNNNNNSSLNNNKNNHLSPTPTLADPHPSLHSTPDKKMASDIDPKTSTNNTNPIIKATDSTSRSYDTGGRTDSTSYRHSTGGRTDSTSYGTNPGGRDASTSYGTNTGGRTDSTSYGHNTGGRTDSTSYGTNTGGRTGYTSYGHNTGGRTDSTSYGTNTGGRTGYTSYGHNRGGRTDSTSYGHNTGEWEYDGNCMDKEVWRLEVNGPNYINEGDGRDAKISWIFPYGVSRGSGSTNPRVKLKYTDLSKNSSQSKACYSYYVPSRYNYGGGFGFMGFGGGGSRPKHECSCTDATCDFTIQLNPETKYKMEMSVEDRRGIEVCPFEKETFSGIPIPMRSLSVLLGGVEGRRHNTYKIGLNTGQYNDAHGAIKSVSLALASNDYLERDKYGWVSDLGSDSGLRDNPSYSMPEAQYRVFDGLNTSVSMFVFGEDDVPESEQNKSCLDCNYPLLPSTYYRFKVRVFTERGFRDVAMKTFLTQEEPRASSAYVMGIVLLVIVVVFVALAVLATRCLGSPAGGLERRVSVDLSWMLTAEELMRAQKTIRLTNLSIVCDNLFRNGRAGLLQEFTELHQVTPSNKDTVAALPANAIKNRYSNIHPYDESRVILRKFKAFYHSDYINASYIHGHKKAKMFIAAQGPLNNTRQAFWRMVWEKQVHIIVMLTTCVQNGVEKCYKYWPGESETLEYSLEQLTVTSLKEIVNSHFVARKFSLVKKGKKPRDVYQYHFVAWPDMGCPSSPDHLLSFLNQVKKAQPPAGHPIVVHCSAGVGRTGTFIGLYNLMDQMEQGDTVDIFNTVLRMRCHRPHMVQTLDQYAFIYQSMVMLYSGETGMQETSFMEDPGQAPRPPSALIPSGIFPITSKESGYTSADDNTSSDTQYLGQFHPSNYPDPPPYPAGFGDPETTDDEDEHLLASIPDVAAERK
ncbi:hypothetical protein Pmani_029475 [Petrolisthes manimaculis]|uniref:protein-tyrosine-phosphatase n=1 Tax=Petrolisthes manimaculis TaxID=1843537 RepID=A0AAE1TUK7_9EUCA|nr:hypothetical protein Pmani_029475 [Petrolisthes manimaculis]